MKIRNRVTGLRFVKAAELTANTKNWREHPPKQQEAMREMLFDIGYADALVARETKSGELVLIDGHLRAGLTPNDEVPVLVLDVSESEADKLLLSLDPLASMADVDTVALDALIKSVEPSGEAIAEVYADLADAAGLYKQSEADKSSTKEVDVESFAMQCQCPECGFEFDDKQA
jgi:predicted Zn-ribbon and HTH transcriptional regulator